jgi:hypothetical protein
MAQDPLDEIDFSGMTVNERFFEAGLLGAWETAKRTCDRRAMATLLMRVGFSERSAEATADLALLNDMKRRNRRAES